MPKLVCFPDSRAVRPNSPASPLCGLIVNELTGLAEFAIPFGLSHERPHHLGMAVRTPLNQIDVSPHQFQRGERSNRSNFRCVSVWKHEDRHHFDDEGQQNSKCNKNAQFPRCTLQFSMPTQSRPNIHFLGEVQNRNIFQDTGWLRVGYRPIRFFARLHMMNRNRVRSGTLQPGPCMVDSMTARPAT